MLLIVTVNQLQSCFPIQTIGRHDYEMFSLVHKIVSMLAQSKYYKTSKAVITFFQGDYVQNPDLRGELVSTAVNPFCLHFYFS